MREILFRGKRRDNGLWETGSLVIVRGGISGEQVSIVDKMTGYLTPVIPKTVGQYTGLSDRNGRKIFEGDIVDVFVKNKKTVCRVAWAEVVGQWQLLQANRLPGTASHLDLSCYDFEIIGNIYDNPELFKMCNI